MKKSASQLLYTPITSSRYVIFSTVCGLSFCWFVSLSAGFCKPISEPICAKLGGGMGHGPGKNQFYFGGNTVKGADPGNLLFFLNPFL